LGKSREVSKLLLIDGVKYELWTPPSEDEFERVVKEHSSEIFGKQSIYLDRKQKLTSLSGIGSIPDGYAIVFGNSTEWHIVEMELSTHDLYGHIVPQVTRFATGINNWSSKRDVIEAIHGEVVKDDFLKLKLTKAIGQVDIHKFLTELISKPPILSIIIDEATEELEDVKRTLAFLQIRVVEFQTFRRDGAETVHAHLFEPLHRYVPLPPPLPISVTPTPFGDNVEIEIRNPSFIKFYLFVIPKNNRPFFPGYKILFTLETDIGEISTWVTSRVKNAPEGQYIQGNLAEWYKKHPTIKVGDKVRFTVIEPMKRYRLEIVK
jgi:hypothetical protein